MHYVDRGSEPNGVKKYRDLCTPRWIDYYEQGIGSKPTDSHWNKFHNNLREAFLGLCGYCECDCKGEVDHFRPKSQFPQRVYDWSNWVFSCHDCNNSKREKWPNGGYVDPCTKVLSSRPEEFFDFDLKTGEITPRTSLTPTRWAKASKMIDDLKLNAFHHLRRRLTWISLVSEVLKGDNEDDPDHDDFVQHISARDCQFSSITRILLLEQGYLVSPADR